MGWTHRCNFVTDRTEHADSGATITITTYVRCTECGRTGVSGVRTELNPAFRDAVIDRQ